MNNLASINEFLALKNIAVAGVSANEKKFGSVLYKTLADKGYSVYPIHPAMETFQDRTCYHAVKELPEEVTGLVISTKPEITKTIVEEAVENGIQHIWLQQGSSDKDTLASINGTPANIITGRCLLMFIEPVRGIHGFHRWLSKAFGSFPK